MEADTREAMRQRILLAKPREQVAGTLCESAFLAVRELLGAEEADSVRSSVWPVWQWGDFSRYPVSDLMRLADAAADRVESRGGLSYARALEFMGERVMQRVLAMPLSKAYSMAAGDAPQDRLAFSIKSTLFVASYGERRFERAGPNQARLFFFREVMGPSWLRGVYAATTRAMPGIEMTLTLEQCWEPGLEFQFLFSW